MDDRDHDDLDHLFRGLVVAPPPDLPSRVRWRAQIEAQSQRLLALLAADAAALLALLLLGVTLGRTLAGGEVRLLLALAFEDHHIVRDAPRDYAAALLQGLPWPLLLLLALDGLALVVLTSALLRVVRAPSGRFEARS